LNEPHTNNLKQQTARCQYYLNWKPVTLSITIILASCH